MLRISLKERRAYIANAALEVFLEKGYKTASLQEIAEKVKITKAGIYHYFKTKEEILFFILVENNNEKLAKFKAVDPTDNGTLTTPRKILRHVVGSYIESSLLSIKAALLAMRERHQLTGENKRIYMDRERQIFSLLKEKMESVQGIKEQYDIHTILFLIISTTAWFGYWFEENGRLSREEIVDQCVEIICSGVLEV